MPSLSLDVNPKKSLHKKILDAVRERVTASKRVYDLKYEKWTKAEDTTVTYMHERDVDRLRRHTREGGAPQYTTIQVPYSYGVLMASHTYWTTVFMSRTPVLQFDGRHGESEMQTQALEALVDYQVQVGEMMVPWYCWLYDVGKYGIGIIGTYWDEQFSNVSEIVEREDMFLGIIKTGNMKKIKTTRRVKGYTGNKVYNIRPFDFFPDPRVTMMDYQKGEFCAVARNLGWNTIIKRESQGYYINIDMIKPGTSAGPHDRQGSQHGIGEPDRQIEFNPFKGTNQQDPKGANSIVPLFECYIELIPSDWKLGNSDLPEKWVFTTDAKFTAVIGAQPLGANHDKFPINVMELEPEGYSVVSRGMPEILEPVQNTIDWLINSHFYNVRKILNGQYVVDPSRVTMLDMLDPRPGGIIRLKPAGYGTNPAEAVQQLSAVDVTQSHLRDMQTMLEIGQRAVGVNDQLMGVLQGSGRKTATEVRSASTFGVNRLKTNAEFFSAMGWAPMSQMFVQNSQQFYDAEMKLKLVGDLAQDAGEKFINVDPESISGFYDFVPVDGVLPIDRFAQANLWKEILVGMRQMPEVMAGYDMVKMFAWVAQLGGLKNINQFKVKVMSPGQLQQQAQAGNVVPMTGIPTGTLPQKMTGVGTPNPVEPGQIPNLGPTG